jgi:tRNA-dihydrouridine synthase
MGAALLRKPTKLAKMVAGIAAAVELPVTVKIRTGESTIGNTCLKPTCDAVAMHAGPVLATYCGGLVLNSLVGTATAALLQA